MIVAEIVRALLVPEGTQYEIFIRDKDSGRILVEGTPIRKDIPNSLETAREIARYYLMSRRNARADVWETSDAGVLVSKENVYV